MSAAKKQPTPQISSVQTAQQPAQSPARPHSSTPQQSVTTAAAATQSHHTVPPPQYLPGAPYYYNYAAAGYAAPWPAQARSPVVAHPQATQPTQKQPQQPSAALDTADVATLNDALGSAGVDLRAEEENLRQSHQTSQTQTQASQPRGTQRSRAKKQGKKVVFDATHLGARIRTIAMRHGLQSGTAGVTEDSVSYLALALRMRLSKLIEGMIAAAAHREEKNVNYPAGLYSDGSPMWSQIVRRDVAKQLALLERVEREEELAARRERKAREVYASGGQPALPSLDDALSMEQDEEPKKKKKKPDGPGVTAKNMPEDMKKKLSNAVASQAAGLNTGKYAWMNAGNIPTGPPSKKATGATTTSTTPAVTTGGGWGKSFSSSKKKDEPVEEDNRRVITMKDAIFTIERERGHGGGRGAARGWT